MAHICFQGGLNSNRFCSGSSLLFFHLLKLKQNKFCYSPSTSLFTRPPHLLHFPFKIMSFPVSSMLYSAIVVTSLQKTQNTLSSSFFLISFGIVCHFFIACQSFFSSSLILPCPHLNWLFHTFSTVFPAVIPSALPPSLWQGLCLPIITFNK